MGLPVTKFSFLIFIDTVPSSPPASFRGHSLSSTSIELSWGKVPKSPPYKILGFLLACVRLSSTEEHSVNLSSGQLNWVFKGLRKFTNYSCRLRAYNRFGSSTWSKQLVISTDEDGRVEPDWAPNKVYTLHYSLIKVTIPKTDPSKLAELLKKQTNEQTKLQSVRTSHSTSEQSLEQFIVLLKTENYLLKNSTIGNRLLFSELANNEFTFPDRPPSELSALSLDKNSVQLDWRPVSPEHNNGLVLGYRVCYNEVHNTSRVASIKVGADKTRVTIDGLRPNTNYSFQILAFTAKGNGTISEKYFAKTLSGI
ncbi:unnamed protein product [Porites evermanni]|uniref:Fibronectin type-III domain-containing protein n=1 Tax=Porites evermanni TaxID=104178 RepID=A0ABN8M9C3_9CNID|nr:unnamed protein product [Porites evermanni]